MEPVADPEGDAKELYGGLSVSREAMHLQCLSIKNFTGTRYVDDPLPNIALWMPVCIVCL